MKDLLEIKTWKRITKRREEILFDLFEKYISKEQAEYYRDCNCPGSIRTMYLDLKKFIHDKQK